MNEKRYRAFMATKVATMTTIDELDQLALAIPKVKYSIIKHDKDNGTDHFHITLYFDDAKSIQSVAKKLDMQPNFVKKWDKNIGNMYGYMIHHTADAKKTKADYQDYLTNPDKFRTNLDNFMDNVTVPKSQSKNNDVDELAHEILYGKITKKQLLSDDYRDIYYKNFNKLQTALRLYNESLRYNPPDCTTLLITGLSGVGKTTRAKYIADTLYKDFVFASSSNDPLQDYSGEKCVIFDDFRPSLYPFVDMLGLLDPKFRQRTHKSRYYNKPLATELIILTSTLSFEDIQREYHNADPTEDMKQFRRRITQVITIQDGYELTYIYNQKDDTHELVPTPFSL